MSIMFIYKNNKYEMKMKNINTINEALEKYLSLIGKSEKDLIFLYKGKKIEIKNKKLINTNNNIIISVFNKEINKNNNNYVTCPICHNLSNLNINVNNYNISLDNCVNNHQLNDLSIDEFIKNQNNDKIKCDICNNNKNLYNKNFYICSCGKFICKLCIEKHNIKNHIIINFNKRYNICNIHQTGFISYCKDCKLNLCKNCEKEHNKHNIILYKMIMPNYVKINELKNNLKENIKRINEFKEKIDILNEMYNNCIIYLNNDLDGYINLINRMINNLDMLNNYETIYNAINFKLEILNKDIKYFLNENLKNKKIYLMNILDRYINQMDIVYEREKAKDEIKLFDWFFVENNKNYFLTINHRIKKITEIYKINDKKIKTIKIKLFTDKIVNNMNYMFNECTSLLSLADISKWKTNNVTNMNCMFSKCEKIYSLPDISKWNTSNVTNMNYMFNECKSLSSLPDISKWITNNVTNMRCMFNGCKSLYSLPDISKWNTNNITNMSYMFNGCKSLLSLPDISKWNTENVTNMNHMFYGCSSYLKKPSKLFE